MSAVEIAAAPVPRITLSLKAAIDWLPLVLIPLLALASLPLIGSIGTWFSLTINGVAMGMIIFIIASGLTLIFGLMDVMNFGHGLFIAIGAYVAFSVLGFFPEWVLADSLLKNIVIVVAAMVAAMAVTGALGWVFERLLVRRVYGKPLSQILITVGGMVIGEELVKVSWGAELKAFMLPTALRGSINIGDAVVEKYRLFAMVIGVLVFVVMAGVLNRTKLGLLIRAGVQDREMVECLGYRIRTLFVGVFVVGSALAGLGGVMWGLYQQMLSPQMGATVNVVVFIVIIIGGLGSTGGSFLAAILVGLLDNYTGFLAPKVALVSNILLMVAILAWRPNGLYKISNR